MLISPILQTKRDKFIAKIENMPLLPGCYMYKDISGHIIYVGKAKNLFNRVKSYFSNYDRLDNRIQSMIDTAEDIDFVVVDSEVEALILENNLIKKYKPKYNILMRDDKTYIYVRFERSRRANQKPTNRSAYQDFPRIKIVRGKKEDGAEYFGPYPDTMPARRILKRLRRVFPYRTSEHFVYQISSDPLEVYTDNPKPCFYYHIGLCNGACAGLESKEDYQKNFNNLRKFFKGEKNSILKKLEADLKVAVKELNFELAARLRDKINDIKYITTSINIGPEVDDVYIKQVKDKQKADALAQFISFLKFPPDKLANRESFRIECYDISNIQGKNAVGSMVVMIDGQIRPDLYRRFKIRMKNEPNDFAMLQEILTRRFKQFLFGQQNQIDVSQMEEDTSVPKEVLVRAKNWKIDESFSQRPDLIIIDGGKGQLASTYKILYNFNLHNEIPIVGLAKKQEEIFKLTDQFKDEYFNQVNDSSQFSKILLPKKSSSLFLVQRIRDEAHRFAITYHRNLRSKKMLGK